MEKYKLVTTVRGNSLEGLISTESPLGKALLRLHAKRDSQLPPSLFAIHVSVFDYNAGSSGTQQ